MIGKKDRVLELEPTGFSRWLAAPPNRSTGSRYPGLAANSRGWAEGKESAEFFSTERETLQSTFVHRGRSWENDSAPNGQSAADEMTSAALLTGVRSPFRQLSFILTRNSQGLHLGRQRPKPDPLGRDRSGNIAILIWKRGLASPGTLCLLHFAAKRRLSFTSPKMSDGGSNQTAVEGPSGQPEAATSPRRFYQAWQSDLRIERNQSSFNLFKAMVLVTVTCVFRQGCG